MHWEAIICQTDKFQSRISFRILPSLIRKICSIKLGKT